MPEEEAKAIIEVAGDFTEETSKAVRQLALAGVAVIWLFKTQINGQLVLPHGLFAPTSLLLLALLFDFLYFAVGALLWRLDARYFVAEALSPRERAAMAFLLKADNVGGYEVRTFRPTSFLLWAKVLCVMAGYVLLLAFLAKRMYLA